MNWGPSLARGRMNMVRIPARATRATRNTSRVARARRRCSRRWARSTRGPRMMASRAATTIQVRTRRTSQPSSRTAAVSSTIAMVAAMVRTGTRGSGMIFRPRGPAWCPRSFGRRRRGPEWGADVMEVADGLGVGAEQAGLDIGQAVLGAERPHQRLGPAQVGPWDGGEQVVLDLVVEPAQHEGDHPAAGHVAGGQHLAAQEVELIGLGQGRHAL